MKINEEQAALLLELFMAAGGFLNRFNDTRANMRKDEQMAYEAMQMAFMACQNAEVDIALARRGRE